MSLQRWVGLRAWLEAGCLGTYKLFKLSARKHNAKIIELS